MATRPRNTQLQCLHRRTVHTSSTNAPLKDIRDWRILQDKRQTRMLLTKQMENYGSEQNKSTTWQPQKGVNLPPKQATLSALLAAGAHFGHNKGLMNPNFMPYAYGVREDATIIDLDHTLPLLRRAANVVRAVAAENGTIVFIGTRPDLRQIVRKAAERVGEQAYHVGDKWLAGTLTNKYQMFGKSSVEKELVVPDLVIILNPLQNMNAIRECAIDHVPTIGIIDSNVDPRLVMYPIPANDESTRTAEVIAGILSIAGREGAALRRPKQTVEERVQAADDHSRQPRRMTGGVEPIRRYDP